jgi:ADP-ribose pyrophosphatase YjhB (NUDIX family)
MDHRQDLLETINYYDKTWCQDSPRYQLHFTSFDIETKNLFRAFVSENPKCFDRSHLPGHITGSALVVNRDLSKVLLTHHKKLSMWLQLGGHADGHYLTHEVAMTEAHEESGLQNLQFFPYEPKIFGLLETPRPIPFDLDRHLIPANSRDPEHHHYDVRYLLIAEDDNPPVISEESHDVRWFTLDDARHVTQETSMLRQFSKLEWIRKSYIF